MSLLRFCTVLIKVERMIELVNLSSNVQFASSVTMRSASKNTRVATCLIDSFKTVFVVK